MVGFVLAGTGEMGLEEEFAYAILDAEAFGSVGLSIGYWG